MASYKVVNDKGITIIICDTKKLATETARNLSKDTGRSYDILPYEGGNPNLKTQN